MAKQTEGFLGGFNGKLGPVVGYRWKGLWCMRSQSRFVNNPRTEAQQAHRALFKAEVQLAGRMRWAVNIGLKLPADDMNMTTLNLFVKANKQAFSAVDGALKVDYAALQVSGGPVAPVAMTEASVDGDNVLNVRFEKNPLRRSCQSFDNVYFWIYNEELEQGYLSNAVYRRMQKASVALPDAFFADGTPALHVYDFVQDAQGRCSETAYAGVAGFSGASGASGFSGVSGFSGETVDPETGEVLAPTPSATRGTPPRQGDGRTAADGLSPSYRIRE
jgi:hypothetical protein